MADRIDEGKIPIPFVDMTLDLKNPVGALLAFLTVAAAFAMLGLAQSVGNNTIRPLFGGLIDTIPFLDSGTQTQQSGPAIDGDIL